MCYLFYSEQLFSTKSNLPSTFCTFPLKVFWSLSFFQLQIVSFFEVIKFFRSNKVFWSRKLYKRSVIESNWWMGTLNLHRKFTSKITSKKWSFCPHSFIHFFFQMLPYQIVGLIRLHSFCMYIGNMCHHICCYPSIGHQLKGNRDCLTLICCLPDLF